MVLWRATLVTVGSVTTLTLFVLPNLDLDVAGGVAVIVALMASMGVFTGYVASRSGPVSIEDGEIRLPFTVRKDHGKTREVPISNL